MNRLMYSLFSATVGAAAACIFLQPSFANSSSVNSTDSSLQQKCAVRVGSARFTAGDRCYRDEVMVGRRDDYIYCAAVEVTCN